MAGDVVLVGVDPMRIRPSTSEVLAELLEGTKAHYTVMHKYLVSLWSSREYKFVLYSSALEIMIKLELMVPLIGGKN